MRGLLQDFRFGIRALAKAPGLVAVAVLTMAIGIGANVAIFSLVDGIWLRPLLVREPSRIVSVFTSGRTVDGVSFENGESSYADFLDLKAQAKSFSGVVLIDRRGSLLYDRTETKMVSTAVISDNFFDVMQVTPMLGRTFSEAEVRTRGTREVLLSYTFWKRQFLGDRSLIGRTIILNGQDVAVIGVLPRGFRVTGPLAQDTWMPVSTRQQIAGIDYSEDRRDSRYYQMLARLKDGVTPVQANAELATIAANLAQAYPQTNAGRRMSAVPESWAHRQNFAVISLILLTITGLVLFIACANVATLLLARAEYRQHDFATRVALGASRWRIVRQMMAEAAIIAVVSTALALFLARVVDGSLPSLMPAMDGSSSVDAYISPRVFGFALLVGLVSIFLFGLLPSRQASRISPAHLLKQVSGVGPSRAIARSVLVVLQIAFSVVMVVGTGLLVRTVQKMAAADPGFDAHQNMLVMNLVPSMAIKGPEASRRFLQEARRRIEALPGVVGTAAAMRIPFGLSGGGATKKVFLPNATTASGAEGLSIFSDPVSDSFFEVMGTRLIRGRTISTHEAETDARVMVVNQLMAQRCWPNADPIGKTVRLNKPDGPKYEIIGVVENGIYEDFGENPKPYLFTPIYDEGEPELVVKTSVPPETVAASVRQTLRDLNKDVPAIRMISLRDHVREAMYAQLTMSTLVAILGSLGLLLAAVGLYGLMSFLVGRRTKEFGVRMALGAQRGSIFRLVIRRALMLSGIGIVLGIAGALVATQVLRGLLFGVAPTDLFSFVAAVLILAAVACGAAFLPALRATLTDPMAALRYE